jgi:trimeric autotransporter adhesin
MKPARVLIAIFVLSLFLAPALLAQSRDSANPSTVSTAAAAAEVPRLIKFSGTLLDAQERPMAGPVGVTFALYSQQSGGAALWMETQNVKPEANGVYTVLLGANSANGVPAELFVSGEARWLGIQVGQQPEHERILLVSVPYALKAGDAETLGGLPASAFVTTTSPANTANSAGAVTPASSTARPGAQTQTTSNKSLTTPQVVTPCSSVTSDGTATANSLALFTTACNVESSLMTQALINGFPGVGVAGNNAGLRLSGTGTHQVTVTGATSGRLGQDANGFFFASDTKGSNVRFLTNNGTLNEWMRVTSAGNIGIGTSAPAAKLDINGNLNLPTTASAIAGVISLGGASFAHNFGTSNTFLGTNAGNFTMSGLGGNTAVGTSALQANTTGFGNTAVGANVLVPNTMGSNNTAVGGFALGLNTTGQENTAVGVNALLSNTAGSNNTAVGSRTLQANTASGNTAVGFNALHANTTSGNNTALGANALQANISANNTAVGTSALQANTTGVASTAIGFNALAASTTANNNTAVGVNALLTNSMGGANTAVGLNALEINSTGNSNTAVGVDALRTTTGSSNIAIGAEAGSKVTTGSNNILIFDAGTSGDNQVIRIGTEGTQAQTFIAGIAGVGVAGSTVLVSGSGQLGVAVSTRRAKEDIHDMGEVSRRLLQLRPVTFRYRKPLADGSKPLQYGLIAEEVAEVMPELVVYDAEGKAQTIQYHVLPALLLNELQKQQRLIQGQQERIWELTGEVRKLRRAKQLMAQLEARLARLEFRQKAGQAKVPGGKAQDPNSGRNARGGG